MSNRTHTVAGQTLSFVGATDSFRTLEMEIHSAARTQAKVLILGETGVGKEIVARLIHGFSSRKAQPFIAMNCSGIPETLLESELFGHVRGSFTGAYRDKPGVARMADRGTLFLDELGEMSLRMQAVLLRFAETGEIQPIGADTIAGRTDARIVAATNRDLKARVAAQEFREDLYYRLNVIQIYVPPLRERREDIPMLLAHFLEQASTAHRLPLPRLTRRAEDVLVAYRWTGNIRELKNLAERMVVREHRREIDIDDLPREIMEHSDAVAPSAAGQPADYSMRGPRGASAGIAANAVAEELWEMLSRGESFWTVVHERFRNHDITRADVQSVIKRGLRQTRGSYRGLLPMLNLPASDYKRLLSFLHQHDCHVPFQAFRTSLVGDTSASHVEAPEALERVAG